MKFVLSIVTHHLQMFISCQSNAQAKTCACSVGQHIRSHCGFKNAICRSRRKSFLSKRSKSCETKEPREVEVSFVYSLSYFLLTFHGMEWLESSGIRVEGVNHKINSLVGLVLRKCQAMFTTDLGCCTR
ncbi:hypothetical protein T11_2223 [Trichinella zimbabwensis]|uniref:Uncharacterized protein n=1 Tax=Trichinella zimbabwensis TaxID=268475 RepID=A0A0V1I3K0_9BILA|nr:hypothetical protein T11_2223 [Trichinella zimbabwensis]